ncbi:MAG: hypothetical protein QM706_09545 [Nitrospira sp.]
MLRPFTYLQYPVVMSPRGHKRTIKIGYDVEKRRNFKLKFKLPPTESTTKPINLQAPHVPENLIKTTVELPLSLWRAVKMRALDDRSDLRGIIITALQQYLGKKGTRPEE